MAWITGLVRGFEWASASQPSSLLINEAVYD